MARRNRRSSKTSRSNPYLKRDDIYITNLRLLSNLRPIEDRRLFHPQGVHRPARSFTNPRHRLRSVRVKKNPKKVQNTAYPSFHIGFEAPKRVLVCVRRKQRREVIHALGYSGRGVGRKRRSRRSEYSSINC